MGADRRARQRSGLRLIRSTGSSVTTTTGRNKNVAMLPDFGKQHLTKSASGARCHSALAAAR